MSKSDIAFWAVAGIPLVALSWGITAICLVKLWQAIVRGRP